VAVDRSIVAKRSAQLEDMADRLLVTSRVWLKVSNLKWIPGVVDGVGER
jgi:hypothetical protein